MVSNLATKFKQIEIGEIPKDWEVKPVSEIAEIISGGTPKTAVDDYWNGEIPWLSVADFNNRQRYVYKSEKHITPKGLNNSATNILKKGMLVISARGTVGVLAQIGRDMTFNQSCYGLNAKGKLSNDFLYYALLNRIEALKQRTHGSVFSTITRKTFGSFLLPIPPLDKQRQLALILSSLDEKIELNRRMNKTLEEIGQALFKHWFVDFNFPFDFAQGRPDLGGKPYKEAGGQMIDSELGEIPEGWGVVCLPEVAEIQKGLSYKGKDLVRAGDCALVGLKCIERGGGFRKDGFKFYGGDYKSKHTLNPGDLIIAMTDLTQAAEVLGKPAIVPPLREIKTMVASLDISIIRPLTSGISQCYLYLLLRRPETQDFLYGYSSGSTVLHLRVQGLHEFKLAKPSNDVLAKFNNTVEPFFQQIARADAEIETLTLLRDSLLPRLMSGRLRVN